MTEIVCQISRVDFPEKWPRLIQVLTENLQTVTDFDQLGVTLGTLEQLVNRYRHEMRSNRLWSEIILVVTNVSVFGIFYIQYILHDRWQNHSLNSIHGCFNTCLVKVVQN